MAKKTKDDITLETLYELKDLISEAIDQVEKAEEGDPRSLIDRVEDCLVEFDDAKWECVDKGFKDNEDIEVVLRPEDMHVVAPQQGKVEGNIISKVFMGVHYEYFVETKYRNYKVHTTENIEVGKHVGLTIDPYDIQVMHTMDN